MKLKKKHKKNKNQNLQSPREIDLNKIDTTRTNKNSNQSKKLMESLQKTKELSLSNQGAPGGSPDKFIS